MQIKNAMNVVFILTCAMKGSAGVENGVAGEGVSSPSAALTDCVTWDKPHHFSEPQFQDPF